MIKRLVLLNALPLNAIDYRRFDLSVYRVDFNYFIDSLTEKINRGVELVSYIRHPSTVSLLNKHGITVEPSSGLYKYKNGDVMFIVTVKTPQRGQEMQVTESDLDCYIVFCEIYSGFGRIPLEESSSEDKWEDDHEREPYPQWVR